MSCSSRVIDRLSQTRVMTSLQKGRGGALLCSAAYFFIVKDTVNGGMLLFFPLQKTLQRSKSTLQIVQTGAGNKFFCGAPNTSFLPVIQEKIVSEDLRLLDLRRLGNQPHKRAFCADITVKGEKILLRIIFIAFVDIPVHMDGQIWDQQQIPVDVDQPGNEAAIFFIDDASAAESGLSSHVLKIVPP